MYINIHFITLHDVDMQFGHIKAHKLFKRVKCEIFRRILRPVKTIGPLIWTVPTLLFLSIAYIIIFYFTLLSLIINKK